MAEPQRANSRRKILSIGKEPWHLDKRVPILLILTIFAQIAGFIWYASKLDSRVSYLEEQVHARSSVNERLARMEERIDGLRENTARIERLIRNMARKEPER